MTAGAPDPRPVHDLGFVNHCPEWAPGDQHVAVEAEAEGRAEARAAVTCGTCREKGNRFYQS